MLSTKESKFLTQQNLKILRQNKITTLFEFLNEDIQKLCALTKLNLPTLLAVRDDILKKHAATPLVGSVVYNLHYKKRLFSTGIISLDNIIGSRLPLGYIIEVCGLANSGKTQLCLSIMLNLLKAKENTALYIDTKGDFSAVRMQKILEKKNFSHQEMANLLNRIRVVRVWTMQEIVEFFSHIKAEELTYKNMPIIIIDSLPSLMFQYIDDINKNGLKLLNQLVNLMNFLCKEWNLIILVVNIQTRWVEQTSQDNEDMECTAADGTDDSVRIEKKSRCLGKYWQHIPALVLQMERSMNLDNCVAVTITKSVFTKSKISCSLKIDEFGIL